MILRLARIGIQNVKGYFSDLNQIPDADKTFFQTISPEEFVKLENINIYDVRGPGEYNLLNVEGSHLFPLNELQNLKEKMDKDKKIYLHCGSGVRSLIAISYLRKFGFENFVNVEKGINGLKNINYHRLVE